MEIKIDTSTEEEKDKVIYFVKRFCIEHFRKFKLYIDGELEAEQK